MLVGGAGGPESSTDQDVVLIYTLINEIVIARA